MPKNTINFFSKLSFLFWTYVVITVAVSMHRYFLGHDHYGNYLIFKHSFFHLLHGKDLYALYPELKIDLFKYSPTFSVLFSPFTIMPDYIGLVFWNLFNSMLLFFAIKQLHISERIKSFILWFILIELITSMQNFQSNALTAALMIFVFASLEKEKYTLAGISAAAGFFIKIFGILGALFWFMYPRKGKFFLSSVFAAIVLLFLPLLFVSPIELLNIYKNWFNLFSTDVSHELNHSVISILKNWFNVEVNKSLMQAIGFILLVLPLFRKNNFLEINYRLLFLCSVLIWSVIFNHKAESPTYIIAVVGVSIWFFISKRSPLEISMILFLFLLTSLSPTDLFPKDLRDNYIIPYSLKALPCILIWIKIQYDLLSFGRIKTVN